MARWRRLVQNPNLLCQALFAVALAVVPACGDDSDDGGSAGRGGSGRGGSSGSSGGAGTGGLAGSSGGNAGTGGGTAGTGGGNAGTGGSNGGNGGRAGSGGSAGSPGDVSAGQVVAQNNCVSCHTADMGGNTIAVAPNMYARNLTPHATGIANWTDQQITRAVREGRDAEDNMLCPTMPRFGTGQINNTQLRNLIAYLRSLTPVDRTIPASSCD